MKMVGLSYFSSNFGFTMGFVNKRDQAHENFHYFSKNMFENHITFFCFNIFSRFFLGIEMRTHCSTVPSFVATRRLKTQEGQNGSKISRPRSYFLVFLIDVQSKFLLKHWFCYLIYKLLIYYTWTKLAQLKLKSG